MPVIEPAIRPPSEAASFLLQVTTGCSANSCSFCGAYLNKPFAIKSSDEIESDIAQQVASDPATKRIFLMDGDALAINNQNLLPILNKLNKTFPKLNRIASYANGYNMANRSDDALKALVDQKLSLIYMGLESGSQRVLDICDKKATVEQMIEAVKRCDQVGIKTSIIVLLGLGGKAYSQEHVEQTIMALNQMQPYHLSFLSVMAIPGTKLAKQIQAGDIIELEPIDYLKEAKAILQGLDLTKTIFHCNHASNYLALEGRLPQAKSRLIEELENAINNQQLMRPEYLRGL